MDVIVPLRPPIRIDPYCSKLPIYWSVIQCPCSKVQRSLYTPASRQIDQDIPQGEPAQVVIVGNGRTSCSWDTAGEPLCNGFCPWLVIRRELFFACLMTYSVLHVPSLILPVPGTSGMGQAGVSPVDVVTSWQAPSNGCRRIDVASAP